MSISGAADGLPNGPGVFTRWLMAIPLWLAAFVGVPVGLAFVRAWGEQRSDEAFHKSVSLWRVEPVSEQFTNDLRVYLPVYGWLMLGLVVLMLVNRHRITRWPWIVVVPTVVMAASTSIVSPIGSDQLTGFERFVIGSPWLVGAGAILLSWGLAWLAVATLTRPLATDIAASSMEVPVPRRGRRPFRTRMLIQRDQLTLHRIVTSTGSRSGRFVIPFDAFEGAQAGEIHSPAPWKTPAGVETELPEGQLVRVVGSGQEWFLPVVDAASVVRVIRARVAHRGGVHTPVDTVVPTEEDWEKAQETVERERDWQGKAAYRSPVYPSRHGLLIAGVVCSLLVVPTLPGVHGDWEPGMLLGTAFFGGLAAFALFQYRKLRRSYRITEKHPRRPGSESKPTTVARTTLPGWMEHTVI